MSTIALKWLRTTKNHLLLKLTIIREQRMHKPLNWEYIPQLILQQWQTCYSPEAQPKQTQEAWCPVLTEETLCLSVSIEEDSKTDIEVYIMTRTNQVIMSFLNEIRNICLIKIFNTRNNISYLLWFNRSRDTILCTIMKKKKLGHSKMFVLIHEMHETP